MQQVAGSSFAQECISLLHTVEPQVQSSRLRESDCQQRSVRVQVMPDAWRINGILDTDLSASTVSVFVAVPVVRAVLADEVRLHQLPQASADVTYSEYA